MGEVAVAVAKWALKLTFWMGCVISIIVMLTVMAQYLIFGFNFPIIGDLMGIIQIWCPFNIGVMFTWLTVMGTSFITYRLALMAYSLMNSYIGR